MVRPHVKFKLGDERFCVHHRGRMRGVNRNLQLYQYDGEQWNKLEEQKQEEAVGYNVGEVPDRALKQWGISEAKWYVE